MGYHCDITLGNTGKYSLSWHRNALELVCWLLTGQFLLFVRSQSDIVSLSGVIEKSIYFPLWHHREEYSPLWHHRGNTLRNPLAKYHRRTIATRAMFQSMDSFFSGSTPLGSLFVSLTQVFMSRNILPQSLRRIIKATVTIEWGGGAHTIFRLSPLCQHAMPLGETFLRSSGFLRHRGLVFIECCRMMC